MQRRASKDAKAETSECLDLNKPLFWGVLNIAIEVRIFIGIPNTFETLSQNNLPKNPSTQDKRRTCGLN